MAFSFSDLKKAQQKFAATQDPSWINDPKLDRYIIKKAKDLFDMEIKVVRPDSSIFDGKYCIVIPAMHYFKDDRTFFAIKGGEIDGIRVRPKMIDYEGEFIPFSEWRNKVAIATGRKISEIMEDIVAEIVIPFDDKKDLDDHTRKEIRGKDFAWRATIWPMQPTKDIPYPLRPIFVYRQGPRFPKILIDEMNGYLKDSNLWRWNFIQQLLPQTQKRMMGTQAALHFIVGLYDLENEEK